jgi:hypothetical protein
LDRFGVGSVNSAESKFESKSTDFEYTGTEKELCWPMDCPRLDFIWNKGNGISGKKKRDKVQNIFILPSLGDFTGIHLYTVLFGDFA